MRRDWKRVRPKSLTEALRLCKEFAQERQRLSVERIADLMGVSHDTLHKWLGTGRMPLIQLPTYEHICGVQFASTWLVTCGGSKLLIDMPRARKCDQVEMVELNSGCAAAIQLLANFYAEPGDPTETLAAIQAHLQQMAWHHANVAAHATPELDFEATA